MHEPSHEDIQDLLPWYVTGRLDASEQARVQAHLSGCADCQAELRFERRLASELVGLPVQIEHSWKEMLARIEPSALKRPPAGQRRVRVGSSRAAFGRKARAVAPWLALAAAAQVATVLVVGAVAPSNTQPERYHALGAAPAVAAGNVVVMFKPDAKEQDLRRTLEAVHARLVDGPTAADAYVLAVPGSERATALATLRRGAVIALAEPVDADTAQ